MNKLIIGTQTESTLNWTGVTSRNYLYDDMVITFKLPYSCSANPTLNLELFDGTTTGPIQIYSDKIYFAAGDEFHLTYSSVKDGRVGWYTKEVYDGDYGMPIFESWTSADNAQKYIANENITVVSGGHYVVRFAYGNTAVGPLTIRVNYAIAAPLYINDLPSSATNYAFDPGYYYLKYDGTNYYIRTDGKLNADITGTSNRAINDEDGNPISTTYYKAGGFAHVTGTLNSTSDWSSYVSYPSGFSFSNSQIISLEINYSNSWRMGVGISSSTINRTFAAMDSNGIRVYNNDSNLYSCPFRICLRKLS